MFFTAKTYPPACFFKKQAGLVVVLFCQLVFQFSALAVEVANEKKTTKLLNQTLANWLDLLKEPTSKTGKRLFTKNAKLILLDTPVQKEIKDAIQIRKEAFKGGKYRLKKVNTLTQEDSSVILEIIVRWTGVEKHNKKEKALIKQVIKLVYSENIGQFLISSVFEEVVLPSDNLAVQLRC